MSRSLTLPHNCRVRATFYLDTFVLYTRVQVAFNEAATADTQERKNAVIFGIHDTMAIKFCFFFAVLQGEGGKKLWWVNYLTLDDRIKLVEGISESSICCCVENEKWAASVLEFKNFLADNMNQRIKKSVIRKWIKHRRQLPWDGDQIVMSK